MVVIILISLAYLASAEVVCPPKLIGYTFVNPATSRCYQFVYDKEHRRTWADARQLCQDRYGRLLNVETREKQDTLEHFLDVLVTKHKLEPTADYNPLDNRTWAGYDPDIWIGASRDSDGVTWRWDMFTQSRSSSSMVVTWFNWGDDPKLIKEMEAERNKYTMDVCMKMRYRRIGKSAANSSDGQIDYPWYMALRCSDAKYWDSRHPFICEYNTYDYRPSQGYDWLIVLAVLGACVACGFIACALYCLWDKMHTSYNVLTV